MIKKINDIATVSRGASPRPIDYYLSSSGYPWLKISDVTIGEQYVYETKQFIKASGLSRTKYLPENTFVITNSATPGIPFFLGKPMCLHDGFLYLQDISVEINQKYLFYWFLANRKAILSQGAGSIFTNLKADIVKNIELYYPNLQLQHHIVNIMESVDNMIYSLKRNRDKMNNMLYGTLSKHFCSNKVKPCLLEDLMMLKKGKQFNGDKLTTDGIYKMYNGGASYSGLLNDWNTQKDTIIISEGGNSCGFVNYIRENFWAGGHCYYAIPNKKCNKKYLYYVLKYCQEKIMKLRVGSGLPNIQKKSLYKFEIMMSPEKSIQDEYQLIFDSFENKINSLDLKIKKYENIREGLLNGLFTGKIDVPENYEEV